MSPASPADERNATFSQELQRLAAARRSKARVRPRTLPPLEVTIVSDKSDSSPSTVANAGLSPRFGTSATIGLTIAANMSILLLALYFADAKLYFSSGAYAYLDRAIFSFECLFAAAVLAVASAVTLVSASAAIRIALTLLARVLQASYSCGSHRFRSTSRCGRMFDDSLSRLLESVRSPLLIRLAPFHVISVCK